MSEPFQSSPITCARQAAPRRVTDVAEVIEATGIDAVTNDGQRVALRFATRRGIVVVQAPLKPFIEKARAPLDSNCRPFTFRSPDRKQLEADAQQIPVTKGGPDRVKLRVGPHRYGRGGFGADKIAALRHAWAEVRINGEPYRPSRIADFVGCSTPTVRAYFERFDAQADSQADAADHP